MTTSDGADASANSESNAGSTSTSRSSSASKSALLARWLRPESRTRRILLAAGVYLVCSVVFAALAGPERLLRHTPFNHYALLADAWLHGRQDLAHGPPGYAQNNDFVEYGGKTFISFPPFPAFLMLPFVRLAGSPEDFRDGQFVIWLAGIAPAALFLVLEKLRRTGRSPRSETQNLVLSALFAFGTVYFFTAVEGTVWFAAMVVAAALEAFYVLAALDAERPLLAGVLMGCAYLTRPPVFLTSIFFALEALRVSTRGGFATDGSWRTRLRESIARLDPRALLRRYLLFAAPIALAFAIVAWMNWTRYARPTPFFFDHELLTVGWRARMQRWGGMLSYHFLAKNLGIALTSLPWLPPAGGEAQFGAPFKINEHGLALWFTTPLYLWLLWPKLSGPAAPASLAATAGASSGTGAGSRASDVGSLASDVGSSASDAGSSLASDGGSSASAGGATAPACAVDFRDRRWLYAIAAVSAALPALMGLLYQNSGWRQFGYRFSNDYAVLLFVLLAIGARPMRITFGVAAAWSVAWNLFGAATFDKVAFDAFYFRDGSQTIVYQPD